MTMKGIGVSCVNNYYSNKYVDKKCVVTEKSKTLKFLMSDLVDTGTRSVACKCENEKAQSSNIMV